MKISILTIGDELLKGDTINTNAAFIGEALLGINTVPQSAVTVPDDPAAITAALEFLLPVSDVIITSGGLGPTGDDVTRETIAGFFKLELRRDDKLAARLERQWMERKSCPAPALVLKQAAIPAGARIFENECGTAPGIWMKLPQDKFLCMLPGPPRELRPMVEKQLIPELMELNHDQLFTRKFHLSCISEAFVEQEVNDILADHPQVKAAFCASFEQVKLFLSSRDQCALDEAAAKVETHFHDSIFANDIHSLEEEVIRLLKEHHHTLSVAESCTGGMIAAKITSVSGASEVFAGGVVAYSNEIKHLILGVTNQTIDTYGAVSSQTADAMVENLCARFKTQAGIAVTGIAGPAGGSPEKPVGLVYIAVKAGVFENVVKMNFTGNRDAVRRQAAAHALHELRKLLVRPA